MREHTFGITRDPQKRREYYNQGNKNRTEDPRLHNRHLSAASTPNSSSTTLSRTGTLWVNSSQRSPNRKSSDQKLPGISQEREAISLNLNALERIGGAAEHRGRVWLHWPSKQSQVKKSGDFPGKWTYIRWSWICRRELGEGEIGEEESSG